MPTKMKYQSSTDKSAAAGTTTGVKAPRDYKAPGISPSPTAASAQNKSGKPGRND
jgi:hypothetical protein